MIRRAIPWLVVLAVAGSPAHAFKRITGPGGPLFWDDSNLPLQMAINKKGSADDKNGSLAACDDAAEEWNEVTGTSFDFQALRRTNKKVWSEEVDQVDFFNLIVWKESGFPLSEEVLAFTQSWFFTSNSELVDTDIVFNGQDHRWSTDLEGGTFDVFTVALHELGHVLGLDHVNKKSAIMFPTVSPATRKHLGNDDRKGIRKIYPD